MKQEISQQREGKVILRMIENQAQDEGCAKRVMSKKVRKSRLPKGSWRAVSREKIDKPDKLSK